MQARRGSCLALADTDIEVEDAIGYVYLHKR